MAVAAGANAATSTNQASADYTYTGPTISGGEADVLGVVSVGFRSNSATITTLTWDGNATTESWFISQNPARMTQHYIKNPASATSVRVVISATATSVSGAFYYTGVDQTTPADTAVTSQGTGTSATVDVTSATDDMVVGSTAVVNADAHTEGGGQTERWQETRGSAITGSGSDETGAATVTHSVSWTSSVAFVHGAFNMNAAAGGGGGRIMSSLAHHGGLAGKGGIAGIGGGLAG